VADRHRRQFPLFVAGSISILFCLWSLFIGFVSYPRMSESPNSFDIFCKERLLSRSGSLPPQRDKSLFLFLYPLDQSLLLFPSRLDYSHSLTMATPQTTSTHLQLTTPQFQLLYL
jgi:hypothetical protein